MCLFKVAIDARLFFFSQKHREEETEREREGEREREKERERETRGGKDATQTHDVQKNIIREPFFFISILKP